MTLHPIAPAQLVEHVSAVVADYILENPDVTKLTRHPVSGHCLDGEPVAIVRDECGQLWIGHGPGYGEIFQDL